MKRILSTPLVLLMVVSLLGACSVSKKSDSTVAKSMAMSPTLGGKLFTAGWMQHAAEYQALCLQAYNLATARIDQVVEAQKHAQRAKPLAVITDIDETFLDNSPNAVHQALAGKDYEEASWNNWCNLAEADTLAGAVDFFKHAASRGVTIFYISNRSQADRQGTLKNLQRYGFPFADDEHLMTREDSSNKDSRRDAVMAKYEVVVFLGDNLGDFSHLFDTQVEADRKQAVWKYKELLGTKFIMLPNPNYGTWEKALNQGYPPISRKDSILVERLRTHR